MQRALRSAGMADHSGKAAAAACTAASTSVAVPMGTWRCTCPVAGSNTSPKRSEAGATVRPLM